MAGVDMLLQRHRSFVDGFEFGDLPIPPALATVIVTCVDARVDPAHLFSLKLGETLVIRNPGGRVTPEVVRSLAVLGSLSSSWPGNTGLEVAVIQHTSCGMARLAEADFQQQIADQLGLPADEVAAMAVTDPVASVRADVERLRSAHEITTDMLVSGFVYDVTDGSLTEVTPPAPLSDARH